jgi:Domain of unknown function (DUF4396)
MAGMMPDSNDTQSDVLSAGDTPNFWFVMSMGVLAGFVIAYPMHWWLVANHLKHGMMTVRAASAVGGEPARDARAPEPHGRSLRQSSLRRGSYSVAKIERSSDLVRRGPFKRVRDREDSLIVPTATIGAGCDRARRDPET